MKKNIEQNNRVPFFVPHPGGSLREELDARQLTQSEFAEIIKLPLRTVNEIINEKRSITPNSAQVIGAALGTSASLWLRMQSSYDLFVLVKKKQKKESETKQRSELYSVFPVSDLVKRGYISSSRNTDVLRSNIFEMFGIQDSKGFEKYEKESFAMHRTSKFGDIVEFYLKAWILLGKKLAKKSKVKKFNKQGLLDFAEQIKHYSIKRDGIEKIVKKLNSLGVRIIFLPHFVKTRVDGAATWFSKDEPLIIMSMRYNRIDNFYFTLLHEIGHILLHRDIKTSFVDDMNDLGDKKEEKEADEFAVSMLGLKDIDKEFDCGGVEISILKRLSNELKIHTGLIVGVLHYKHILSYDQFRKELIKVKDVIPNRLIMR